ncbi:hypothetical protein V1523DRAFT_399943 [Lipomyces doorenjongii]
MPIPPTGTPKLLTTIESHQLTTAPPAFNVPGDTFHGGGIIRKVEDAELATVPGTTKVYFYVDNMETAMERIVKNGGKKISEKEPEGDKAFYQFSEDSEGNGQAIYSYAK